MPHRTSKPAPKKRGPPRTGKGEQVVVRMHDPLLSAIDEWCAAQLDRPTRAEALRRLAAQALEARTAGAKRPRGK
jgi:hypothetical protein